VEPQDRTTQRVDTSTTTTGSRRHAMRLLRDEYDEIVLAYELTGLTEQEPRSLIIESSGGRAVTRLHRYPAHWRQLKDDDLLALRSQDA
jgi:hypothetical protein